MNLLIGAVLILLSYQILRDLNKWVDHKISRSVTDRFDRYRFFLLLLGRFIFFVDLIRMSNTMESYLHESRKLDGSNFKNWKFKIQTLLEGANAWSIVTGDEKRVNAGTQEQDWDK